MRKNNRISKEEKEFLEQYDVTKFERPSVTCTIYIMVRNTVIVKREIVNKLQHLSSLICIYSILIQMERVKIKERGKRSWVRR